MKISRFYFRDQIASFEDYMDTYLKNKSTDCILYSEGGSKFKVHKDLFGQTLFLRKILSSANERWWNHWSCLKEFKRQTGSFSEESGPLRHVLWCFGRIFQELFNLNQITSGHTVWTNSILKENSFNCKRCLGTVEEDTVQDFLIELDMKPHLHLVEISIFFHWKGHCQTYQNYEPSRQKLGTFLENKVFLK